MYVSRDGQRLYLGSWKYNAALILTELAKIIENNGGRVKPLYTVVISNRHLEGAIKNLKDQIERLESLEETEKIKTAIGNLSKKLAELELIDNTPITVIHTSYISFIFDDFYYYYQVDDNPFFDFYYKKNHIKDGKYISNTYPGKDKQSWWNDCFLSFRCSEADRKEGANLIFNMLVSAEPSEIYWEEEERKVPNTYNDGWHWEKVIKPNQYKKIDF